MLEAFFLSGLEAIIIHFYNQPLYTTIFIFKREEQGKSPSHIQAFSVHIYLHYWKWCGCQNHTSLFCSSHLSYHVFKSNLSSMKFLLGLKILSLMQSVYHLLLYPPDLPWKFWGTVRQCFQKTAKILKNLKSQHKEHFP